MISLGLNNLQATLLPVFMVAFCDVVSMTIVMPSTIIYAQHLGASKAKVGLVFSCYYCMALLSTLLIGKISDFSIKWRKWIFVIYAIGSSSTYLASGLVTEFKYFLICRGIAGMFNGVIANAYAYIGDVVPENVRPIYLSYVTSTLIAAYIIGPMTGGGLANFGLNVPYFVSFGISLTGMLISIVAVQSSESILKTYHTEDIYSQSSTGRQGVEEQSLLHGGVLPQPSYQSTKHDCDEKMEEGIQLLPTTTNTAQDGSINRPPHIQVPNTTNETSSHIVGLSPYKSPSALLIGGLGSFLKSLTYVSISLLAPLVLQQKSFHIVHIIIGGGGGSDASPGNDATASLTLSEAKEIVLFLGYLLSMFGLIQLLCVVKVYRSLVQTMGVLSVAGLGSFIHGIAFCCILYVRQNYDFIPVYIFLGISGGLIRPAIPAFLGTIAPRDRISDYIGLGTLFNNLGVMTAGLLPCLFADYPRETIVLVGGLSILNATVMLLFKLWYTRLSSVRYGSPTSPAATVRRRSFSTPARLRRGSKDFTSQEFFVHSELQQFFGSPRGKLSETDFWSDVTATLSEVLVARGYSKALQSSRGQALIKDILIHALPELPNNVDERMKVFHQLYAQLGRDEWANELAGLVCALQHGQAELGVPGLA